MTRSEQKLIVRLWKDWCHVWPEQYGHDSLDVHPDGYDPVFDLIPSQAYKDFYFEVIRHHPNLKHVNPFEVVDTALNHVQAPEASPHQVHPAKAARHEPAGFAETTEFNELPGLTVVEVELTAVNEPLPRADSA